MRQKLNKIIKFISWVTLISLVTYDVALLYIYAMDVPFWDVWVNFPRGSFSHLFEYHNENMQFFYFLISEIVYMLFDWNLRYFNFINFFIYIFISFVYWKILSKSNQGKMVIIPLLLMPIFTPMIGYNWLWAMLVQTHTMILFYLCAIYFGISLYDNKNTQILFILFLILSIISMNIPLAIGCLIAYFIKEIVDNYFIKNKTINVINYKRSILSIVLIALFLGVLAYVGVSKDFKEAKFTNVLSLQYWYNLSFYVVNSLNIFAFAHIYNAKICLGLFAVLIFLLSITLYEQYKIREYHAPWCIIFSVMFWSCCVVSFRHGEVFSYDSSFIRHNETMFMLLPSLFFVLLVSKYRVINVIGYVLLFGMICGIIFDIKSERYQFFGELHYKNACECLHYHYFGEGLFDKNWKCLMNYPIFVDQQMEQARIMDLSFIKTVQKCYK